MTFNVRLEELPHILKLLLTAFLLTVSIGYFLGAFFVEHTTRMNPDGMTERFKGTEALGIDLDEFPPEREIQYEKSESDLYNITHTHILSLSMLFVLVGTIFAFTRTLPKWLKSFCIVEPFLSILVTFGGMWFLRFHQPWWSYIIAISGTLMTTCFTVMVLISLWEMWRKEP